MRFTSPPVISPPRLVMGMLTPGAKAPDATPVFVMESSSALNPATVVGRVRGSPPIWKNASTPRIGSKKASRI
jgi:hypothetical protein